MIRDGNRSRLGLAVSVTLVALSAAGGCGGGTSMQWFKNGFIDPTQVGQFAAPRRNEIRSSLGVLEEPGGIQNGEEPTEADLVADFSEPVISPGDVVAISIFELQSPGLATDLQIQIGNDGFATLPVLGRMRLAGYTARGLELELQETLRVGEILDVSDVRVTMLRSQANQFTVIGFVPRPGPYQIPNPDYRLINAMGLIGGIAEGVEKIYVIRRTASAAGQGGTIASRSPPEKNGDVPFTMSDASWGGAGVDGSTGGEQPASRPEISELEILERGPSGPAVDPTWDEATGSWVVRNVATTVPGVTSSPASAPTTGSASSLPTASGPLGQQVTSRLTSPLTTRSDPFGIETGDDERVAPPDLGPPVRILEIPVVDLMAHDPRYNIVIRPNDVIHVPPLEQGPYYMQGHIARPGAYRFPGRALTVKEAITSAGGFSPLAWPARADLIRRVNRFEEQTIQVDIDAIFAGNAPDFYLKPNDMLNVGTTPIAPFLAVLRNSFRMSYGFGFVYDRNFGDQDSFGAREALKNRRNSERTQRGLPIN